MNWLERLKYSIARRADKISFVGFGGASLYDVIKGIEIDDVSIRAAGMAFNFFMALFPSFIFLFTLIPYIPTEAINEAAIMEYLKFFPENIYITLEETITDTITNKRGDLLSVGFLFAIIFSLNGLDAAIQAFNKTTDIGFVKRGFFKKKLVSLILLLSIVLVMFVALTVLFVGGIFIDWLIETNWFHSNFSLILTIGLRWFIVLFLSTFTMSLLYYFGRSTTESKSFFTFGSLLAAVVCIVTSVGFAEYVNNFGQYNKIYGSIGTIIALMLWFYINSMVILIGYEITHSINKCVARNNQKELF